MTAMLERRGPDSVSHWMDGPVGLGHALLATTPEQLVERQPFRHTGSGCVITADARLDNRDGLIRSLGLEQRDDWIGDAELILLSFLNLGDDCLDHLLGDFAFAIWDPRNHKLFCARDHFGMRPLCYHYSRGQRFLFASDPRAILVLPQVPYRINAGRIADFLVPQLEHIDYTSTFFEDVYRLPPGHKLTATANSMEIIEYWTPEPATESAGMSDDEYAGGFLEVFTESVAARLRAPSGSVCSMLSGGIDSGSVVAVARKILAAREGLRLPTYSAIRRDSADCAETLSIHAAITMPSIIPSLLELETMPDDLGGLMSGIEEPFDAEMTMIQCIYRAASAGGHRVVLDGMGGDVVLAEGTYIVRLIRNLQLELAWREIAAENGLWGGRSLAGALIRYGRAAVVPDAIRKRLPEVRKDHRTREIVSSSLISADFAKSVEIEERLEQLRRTIEYKRSADYIAERCRMIRPSVTAGRERYSRAAAAFATEARDPFLDKRVVNFCLRLPGRLLVRDGWRKSILRQVMVDKLPSEVLWQRGKPHVGWRFNRAVTRNALDRGDISLEQLRKDLADYVDPNALQNAWQDMLSGGDGEHLHSAHVLSAWLRENSGRPGTPD
jgi:asparagine synthase (glutamine-hydrolysing)